MATDTLDAFRRSNYDSRRRSRERRREDVENRLEGGEQCPGISLNARSRMG
jgi:hypothetical protein